MICKVLKVTNLNNYQKEHQSRNKELVANGEVTKAHMRCVLSDEDLQAKLDTPLG